MNDFDYYYGIESEQFAFYRIPRILIKDDRFKELSNDAKLLYGLMLDRMSLSMKNKWFDNKNRAYIIYQVNDVMEDLGCGKEKAIKVLAELDSNKGIGLIDRVRRGFGKADIIYVKKFTSLVETENTTENTTENMDEEKPVNADETFENTEVGETDFNKSGNQSSRSSEIEPQRLGNQTTEVGKTDFKKENYTDINNTNINYINNNHINPINHTDRYESDESDEKMDRMDVIDKRDDSDKYNKYMELIRRNIEYEQHMQYDSVDDRELYDELYEAICDVVCVERKTVRIGGEDYPYRMVKAKFLKLNGFHLEYVISCMSNTTTKINNIKSYIITALYNAPSTMNSYYNQLVQHDMYGMA